MDNIPNDERQVAFPLPAEWERLADADPPPDPMDLDHNNVDPLNNLMTYATAYNALRIMSGLGGLSYSDVQHIPDAPPRPYGQWTMDNHFIFLKHTRREIWTWYLLCARMESSSNIYVPNEILQLACGYIATEQS